MPEFQIDIIQLLVICGILQGLVFSILFLFRKTNFRANAMLALFLFSVSFTLFISLVLDFGLYNTYPWLHWLPFSLTFWLGPSFYFYIRFLSWPEYRFRKVDYWHFAPVIFNYVHSAYHLILGRGVPYPKLHNFTEALETYGILSMAFYFVFALRLIRKYEQSILDNISNLEHITLKWLKEFIIVVFASLILVLVFILIDFNLLFDFRKEYSSTYFFKYDDLLKFIIVIALYWLGIRGYFQQSIIRRYSVENDLSKNKTASELEKIPNSHIALLVQSMEKEKLYLNPSLNLRMLEEKIDLSAREISRTLNLGLGKNFYYFINEYRVKEAQNRLSDARYDHLSILGIAFDSGFSSKATFNRIFKELTGESPSQYRKKINTK